IFEPLATLTQNTWKERVIREVVKRGMAVYSPHTALDAAREGVNAWLIRGLGVEGDIDVITRSHAPVDAMGCEPRKIVTFVPIDQVDRVREAMARAGAGRMGNYGKCSFSLQGEGTFQGDADTSPAVGKA